MSSLFKYSAIIGAGEVGNSLWRILKMTYQVELLDKGDTAKDKPDILHICIPYDDNFIQEVQGFIDKYNPKAVVIHSTVPVGTTKRLKGNVYHSPVSGKHPFLDLSIMRFPKFLTGPSSMAKDVEKYFNTASIHCLWVGENTDTTELMKLMDTTYYGWNIVFCKEMKKICDNYGVDFDIAYTEWNKGYNSGYKELGSTEFQRPVLKPIKGAIGGHCVIPNCKLEDNIITKLILEFNDKYEKDTIL